jgi:6-pyruvoyltetrahydropterin/6-carboxytetrahydropterin synthase
MIIRKQFKFEGAHIVRNCSSKRCKFSLHGHSYVVEVFFTGKGLDNGQMIMDFSLMKSTIGDFIDSFDHAYSMWDKENDEFKNFIYANSDRYIKMPVSPSAEAYSLMMFKVIDAIIKNTVFNNGEKDIELHAVRVHETATGYAESHREDMNWVDWGIEDITFSEDIKTEWKDPQMWDELLNGEKFVNADVEQQV